MIGMLVDRFHVSTPTEEVVRKVMRKARKDLTAAQRADLERRIAERHEANVKLYHDFRFGG